MLIEKYGWAIQKNLFAETNEDSTFSHTRENSKMFYTTFLTINHLQAESRIKQGIFLYVIPARIIVPCNGLSAAQVC